jgi:site-specific DNA-methyltransferase (adenine-specific)
LIVNNIIVNNDITKSTTMISNEIELKNDVETDIEIKNMDGLEYLSTIPNSSIDLILTDPPYIISKETGMNTHYNKVKNNEENNVEFVKTEEEWIKYKRENNIAEDKKENYMKYGTIYGKKYCVKTDYGVWDSEFTMETLEKFIFEYYKKLKNGGTIIIFFDLWKISFLKEIMEKCKFKQIRFIEWIKTNPQPLNSGVNYLTNCREIALLGIKGTKPTFNSKYDNGIYSFPLQGGKNRFHPTQKSLSLFEELIIKHSNENDVVLDTFLGGGTTALACKNTKRKFKGCEISAKYFDKIMKLL